jgi:hypothetical protein
MVTLSHLKLCAFWVTDGKITIKTGDPMTFGIISKKTVLDAVAEAAGKLTNTNMRAAAEKSDNDAENIPDGLGELFKFAADNPDIAQMR